MFMIVFTAAVVYTGTHFSRVFVSAALLVSSLLSSMSLNLLYRFSIFLLTSCKIKLRQVKVKIVKYDAGSRVT